MQMLKCALLSLLASIFPIIALGLSSPLSNNNSVIEIKSDTVTIERVNKQSVHEGHVVLSQGGNHLQADKLTITKEHGGKIGVVLAIGNPATFTGKLENEPAPIFGTAKEIYYYPEKQLIVLQGDAELNHQQDKFQSPSLSYQLDKQIVSATKVSNKRPHITIHPRT